MRLTVDLNSSQAKASNPEFWEVLRKVERIAQKRYDDRPLFYHQLRESEQGLAASTVQVQLCEWRQFLEFSAREESSHCSPPAHPNHAEYVLLHSLPESRCAVAQ